jgi:hypothetical protein
MDQVGGGPFLNSEIFTTNALSTRTTEQVWRNTRCTTLLTDLTHTGIHDQSDYKMLEKQYI